MSTLRELIFKRPSRQFQYLHVLLDLCSHEKEKVALGTGGDRGGQWGVGGTGGAVGTMGTVGTMGNNGDSGDNGDRGDSGDRKSTRLNSSHPH